MILFIKVVFGVKFLSVEHDATLAYDTETEGIFPTIRVFTEVEVSHFTTCLQ